MIYDIKVVPHSEQRYDTVGDWIWSKGLKDDKVYLYIRVSDLGDWKMEFLVIIHELIEAVLCHIKGITQMQVDQFDMQYEIFRQPGDFSEPGNSRKAPYYWPHKIASWIERFLGFLLKVDWKLYNERINSL